MAATVTEDPSGGTTAPPTSAGRRALAMVAEVNRTKRPEHDIVLRCLILGTVVLGVLAVVAAGAAPLLETLLVLLLLPVGFIWSHRQRRSSNLTAKGIISVLVILVLWRFFGDVRGIGNVDDARLPLTVMFLEIQVLHAFDLPQRRDLMFTLTSSLALVALALAGGPPTWVAVVVAAYVVLLAVSLNRCQRSVDAEWVEGAERALRAGPGAAARPDEAASSWSRLVPPIGLQLTAIVLLAGLVFASVPLRSDASLGGLPISFGASGPQTPEGSSRVGGDLPFGDSDGEGAREFDPVEYFGFAERVDPRAVGELSDTPILQVRTNRPRPLRGVVFDLYDDGVWGRSAEEPAPVQGLPVRLDAPRSSLSETTRVTQTIELLRPTPNLIFSAADPVEVWTAAQSATPWDDGTVTTLIEMDVGTIYSVVSEVDVTAREQLRSQPFDYAASVPTALDRWTQLPDTVPQRVHDLAAQLMASAPRQTPYSIAETMQDYIGEEIRYSLDGPITPEDADPADHILFDSQVGWCEPIATSMVVMLRSVGIPARFVTGFQPGERQILSGQYIVRASNAHAWVEVFVPNHGWVAFDPTGVTTPVLDPEGDGAQILLADLARWVGERLPDDPVTYVWIIGGLLVLGAAARTLRERLRRAALRRAGPWAGLVARLRSDGLDPPESDTPAEVAERAQRALPHLDQDALAQLVRYEETRRYTTDEVDRTEADRALSRL
ncbi:transglutaminase TgpA family protein [Euzebya tangerina]|uniref:transglutaminase TgpA family protein n=1 Tax=Euzebya tangerina TaxID=591198 RepID=UPI000E315423|nr:transglutaminaseTgpA domain-containing protein [Euzebya tangerina]